MTTTAKNKAKFRRTKIWQAFRKKLKYFYKSLDALTLKPLRSGWAAHHLSMKEEDYCNLGTDRLVPVNKMSHRLIHYCYTYYKDDPEFLGRLEQILQKMKELND